MQYKISWLFATENISIGEFISPALRVIYINEVRVNTHAVSPQEISGLWGHLQTV